MSRANRLVRASRVAGRARRRTWLRDAAVVALGWAIGLAATIAIVRALDGCGT